MKLRHLAFLLPLFLFACHKSNSGKHNSGSDFSYTTTCDSVIRINANSNYEFFFSVTVLTGNISTYPVTYTLTGLPAGVTVTPAAITVTSMLGGVFAIVVGNVAPGDYALALNSTSSGTTPHTQRVILRVQAPADYSNKLAGTYPHSYDFCSPANAFYYYSSTVSTITGAPYEIKISNVKNLGATYTVTATISNVVTIPLQAIGPYTIWGTGTFTHDNPPYDTLYQMTVYDTMVNGSDTEHCTMHIAH